MSPEAVWWAEQYASPTPTPLAASWISKWPVLAICAKCDKQLGHDPVVGRSSEHRCRNGKCIGGRIVKNQPTLKEQP